MRKRSVKLNAVLNIARQISSTLITLITFSYATRVLQVDNYGRLNFCSSFVSYFTLIAGLGISTYAVREAPKMREDSASIKRFTSQMFSINCICTVLAYLLLFLTIAIWKPDEKYYSLLAIYSFNILFTTIGVDWIFSVYEDYLYITVRTIAIHTIQLILVLLFVKGSSDTDKYAIITVGTTAFLQVLNHVIVKKKTHFSLTTKTDFNFHIKPILFLFANSVLIVIYLHSDITMLGIIKTDSEVGLYKAAVNIYQAVKTLLNAIYVVAIPRLSYYYGSNMIKDFERLSNQVVDSLVTFIAPALTGLLLISGNVIWIFSGSAYLDATGALQILSIALLFASLGGFFVNAILIVSRKEKIVIRATAISAFLNITLNFIFIPMFGASGAAFTTMLAEMMVAVIAFLYAKKEFNFSLNRKTLISVFGGCISITIICMIVKSFKLSVLIETITSVTVSVIAYCAITVLFRPSFLGEFIKLRKR